ncbi:hypothetical protein [Micromonospora sp. IBHARD004]|uniref:hypothetical protein n=1 Tax=Micromonospora sp. IBHARD004 TaxID=3457764 RepID=UPI0040588CBC
MRISFSGLDGAGKTRQIEALVAALQQDRSVEVLWIPFRIWPESLLNRLPADFRSRLGPRRRRSAEASDRATSRYGDKIEGVHDPGAGLAGNASRSLPWRVVGTLAAVSAGLSLRRRAYASSADVLVLDRYRLDTIVKLQFWYSDVPGRWLARIVGRLAPAPDVEFLLRVDPAVAYERKPEQWSVEQLSQQARLYDVLTTGPTQVVTLDAKQDPDVIGKTVVSHVRTVLDGR